ncbi:MAG: electron transport complex subunit RsxA [Desulfobacteraceae bacterium]|nr:electron transport complex subunit RsxA [Desulfobacteraceae bacterium]
MEFFELAIGSIFINNIILAQFLGICPFIGTSKKMETAVGMAMAVVFVMVMAGMITWSVDTFLLKTLNVEYLRTLSFILVIASLVQFVEMFLKKMIPGLYAGLGIFLPLITTNCAVMGACLLNIGNEYHLFAGVRERVNLGRVPKPLQDTSIGLVTAGIIALTFTSFRGMV